jgi:hypothetical protein
VLEAGADVAPAEGDPFLVIDRSLSVGGLSGAAEEVLATSEDDAVNRHFTELLMPAYAEVNGPESLAAALTWAARGDTATHNVVVRPSYTFGVRLRARISSCAPPLAALLVLEPSRR